MYFKLLKTTYYINYIEMVLSIAIRWKFPQ